MSIAPKLHDRIGMIISSAGLMLPVPFEMVRFDKWDSALMSTSKAYSGALRQRLSCFRKQKSRQFINVSSVIGHPVSPWGAICSGAKYSGSIPQAGQALQHLHDCPFARGAGCERGHCRILWKIAPSLLTALRGMSCLR